MFYLRFLCFTVALISMGGMHPASVFHAQSTQPAGTDTQLDLTPAEVYALLDQFVDIHMSGKTDEAKPLLQKARRAINAFDESERQTGLGLVCQARYQWYSGDQYSASYTFEKAAKAKPADARVHLAYAHFLKAINNPHGVLPEYRKAYKLDPSFRYVEALVTAYVEKRYYLDAWKLIQKHVAQSPNDERLWPMYGYVALRLRHYPEAEGIYKKLLKKYPESRGYLFSLGDALFYQTKFEEADKIYTQLYQADSNDSGALIAYIQIKHAMAELKPAQEALKKLYALHASGQFKEPAFCREIMFTESHQIEVFESFKLEGDRAVKYTFRVWRDKKDDYQYLYRITLGRYKETNHEARKQGQLKDGEELYQLDLHNDDYREYTTMQYIKVPPAVNYVRLRNGIMRHVMNEEAKQKAEAAEAAKADESSQDTTGE